MKILMTGMTHLQHGKNIRIGETKSSVGVIQKIDVPLDIYKVLSEDHEVDWRRPVIGMDCSEYDAFFVGVGPMLSTNSSGSSLAALWVMSQHHGKPLVLFYDDWQIGTITSHSRTFWRFYDQYLHKTTAPGGPDFYYYEKSEPSPEPYKEEIREALGWWTTYTPNWPSNAVCLCPLYSCGNREELWTEGDVLFPREQLREVDPSGVIPLPKVEHLDEKWNRWVLCALNDFSDWVAQMDFNWPVDYFGCRKMNNIRLRNEREVVREYNERWGILSPPYPQAGSGWFRSRFMYSAHVGSVIYCTTRERECWGLPKFAPFNMERCGVAERRKLRDQQVKIIQAQLGTPEKFSKQVKGLFVP